MQDFARNDFELRQFIVGGKVEHRVYSNFAWVDADGRDKAAQTNQQANHFAMSVLGLSSAVFGPVLLTGIDLHAMLVDLGSQNGIQNLLKSYLKTDPKKDTQRMPSWWHPWGGKGGSPRRG